MMLFPDYKINIISQNKSQLLYEIIFDKVIVRLYGDAKYKRLEIKIVIKAGYKRRNVNLLEYLKSIVDYLISNNYVGIYEEKCVDLLNPDIVKFLDIKKLKITSGEIEYIKEKFPNLLTLYTINCTIYDRANIGALNCGYIDFKSNITSLDSFNGFSGRYLVFNESNILNNNKNFLHLYNVTLKFDNIDIYYETLLLMLDAPNLRKLEIIRPKNKKLSDNDLLFISGLYNLESINIDAIISSMEQIKKLEYLREIKGILLSNPIEMEKIKQINKKYFDIIKSSGASDEVLGNYLMYQSVMFYNKYLDLLNKLHVSRIERVNWENKISLNDLERIRKELIIISKMSYKEKRKISKEVKEVTLKDQLDGLDFDGILTNEEDYIVNSRPFQDGGIDYYVKSKKILLDE